MTVACSPSPREGRGYGGSAPAIKPVELQIVTVVPGTVRVACEDARGSAFELAPVPCISRGAGLFAMVSSSTGAAV
jgi:hypothetical protein